MCNIFFTLRGCQCTMSEMLRKGLIRFLGLAAVFGCWKVSRLYGHSDAGLGEAFPGVGVA